MRPGDNMQPGTMQPGTMQPGRQPGMQPNDECNFNHLPQPALKFVDKTDRFENGAFKHHEIIISIDNQHFFYCIISRQIPNFNPCGISLQQVDMRPRALHQIPYEFSKFMVSFLKILFNDVWSSPIIPVDHYAPTYTQNLTVAPLAVQGYAYMKRPCLLGYQLLGKPSVIADSVYDEAEIGEILMANPHPNIAKYWGCAVYSGRIIGLMYGRYAVTLLDRVKSKIPINAAKCMQDIKDGLAHLHNLGYAHNDLSPANIMLDSNDNAVIIDFDSCTVEGGQLSKLGPPGWARPVEEMTVATRENDFYSLRKIEAWLQNEGMFPLPSSETNDQNV
ncbi:hypothetical protein NW768_008614 [Fusarium equiseti]|uniref:Protein kinase domain-containing protein n=1 Tax=Fusarium equiseti TaxID=61235 RepID=A0ABQ8R4T6_FUSEQ|nr:hypothetical protein NW768_008614 [Fusarium equiseti]